MSKKTQIGTLIVVVLQGRNLPNKRFIGKQNPYCELNYNGESKSTKVIKGGGQHPNWDDEIRFPVYETPKVKFTGVNEAEPHISSPTPVVQSRKYADREMTLTCYSSQYVSIGSCSVDITEALTKGEQDEWFTLTNNNKYSGEIYLEITYWSEVPQPAQQQPASSSNYSTKISNITPSESKASMDYIPPDASFETAPSPVFITGSPPPPSSQPGPSTVPPQKYLRKLPTPPQLSHPPQGYLSAPTIIHIPPSSSASRALVRSASSNDGPVFGSHPMDANPQPGPYNSLPWVMDLKGFRFLTSQSVCNPHLIGAFEDWVVSASSEVLLFTLLSRVIIYNIIRKTAREIDYGFRVKSVSSASHNLSPDGKILVRWMLNEERQVGTLTAIDARSKLEIAQVQRRYQCQQRDILNAKWADNSTIYIPVSAEGVVIRWNIRDASVQDNHLLDITVRTEDPVVIRPLASITRHSILKFAITKDKAWWTATGITLSNPPSGLIEVHDVENDESRIVEGLVSCIVEVDVYDKEKALLVSADVTLDSRLRFCVQQLNPSDSGQSFIPVDMKVDLLEENDYPRDIVVLHPLPIVAVMTEEFYSYFFELHTGAYLFSQSQRPYRLCPGRSDRRGLLIWSHEKSEVEALTVNEGDLIGYCRQVLGNDILASTIAVRTGLPGAEDVVLNDMYGQYRDISSRRAG